MPIINFDTIRYDTILAIEIDAIPINKKRFDTIPIIEFVTIPIRYDTDKRVRYDNIPTIDFDTIPIIEFDTIRYDTGNPVRYDTIRYDSDAMTVSMFDKSELSFSIFTKQTRGCHQGVED